MAVRDRNLFAWQAYVITMAFVSVGLLLGMFFIWRSYSDLSKKLESQKAQLAQTTTNGQAALGRVDRLMSMMGYGNDGSGKYTQGSLTDDELKDMANTFASDEVLAQVEKDFAEQMKLFPKARPEAQKNLKDLPAFLLETIRLRNDQLAGLRKSLEDAQAEMTVKIADAEKARDDAATAQKKAETDLNAERQSHLAERARLNKEKQDAINTFNTNIAAKAVENQKLTTEIGELKAENADQANTIAVQMDIINQFREPDFAAPQGRITKVMNAGTEVWVNLGADDGLREGVPFSIIDESAINISKADPKAKIVVTSVLDAHLSRARLTKYDYRNPVVSGDKVYSPAWRPGRTVGFALVGKLDVNGDSRDDSVQVRELIRLAGGKVDEVMDTKQNRDRSGGGMTPNTSYLVLGTDLALPANATPEMRAEQQQRAEGYKAFMAEARQKGIIEISLDKLMGYLKTEGADRTVPLGDRIRAQDFPARESVKRPSSSGPVNGLFYKREIP